MRSLVAHHVHQCRWVDGQRFRESKPYSLASINSHLGALSSGLWWEASSFCLAPHDKVLSMSAAYIQSTPLSTSLWIDSHMRQNLSIHTCIRFGHAWQSNSVCMYLLSLRWLYGTRHVKYQTRGWAYLYRLVPFNRDDMEFTAIDWQTLVFEKAEEVFYKKVWVPSWLILIGHGYMYPFQISRFETRLKMAFSLVF